MTFIYDSSGGLGLGTTLPAHACTSMDGFLFLYYFYRVQYVWVGE